MPLSLCLDSRSNQVFLETMGPSIRGAARSKKEAQHNYICLSSLPILVHLGEQVAKALDLTQL
jgi:hypothetical protein